MPEQRDHRDPHIVDADVLAAIGPHPAPLAVRPLDSAATCATATEGDSMAKARLRLCRGAGAARTPGLVQRWTGHGGA
eukprot:7989416-Alexandrium_andersonii.AAC.1